MNREHFYHYYFQTNQLKQIIFVAFYKFYIKTKKIYTFFPSRYLQHLSFKVSILDGGIVRPTL